MSVLASRSWPPAGDAGSAPLAVLVHGVAGSSSTWWRAAPALAGAGWQVVGLDLRWHGANPPGHAPATVRDLAADVAETIATLPGGRAGLLLGHSLGGATVAEAVMAHPGIADRVVLEDPPGSARTRDERFAAQLEDDWAAVTADPEGAVRRQLAEHPTWEEEDARLNVASHLACDVAAVAASVRVGLEQRVADLVPRLPVPALVLLAAAPDTAIAGPQRAAVLAARSARLAVVEIASGHTIHRDRFVTYRDLLLGWLDGQALPDRIG